MKKLWMKKPLFLALIWVIAYVVIFSLAENFTAQIGIESLLPAIAAVILTVVISVLIVKNSMTEELGLCKLTKAPAKDYLFYIPMLVICTTNLWNGFAPRLETLEMILFVIQMVCVAILEEVIFRGFLFKAISRTNKTEAIIISSVSFGLGHIVNLLNGAELVPTLLQLVYASALGFLFVVLLLKSSSLVLPIIAHAVINILSGFAIPEEGARNIIRPCVLAVVTLGYALYIYLNLEKEKK